MLQRLTLDEACGEARDFSPWAPHFRKEEVKKPAGNFI
jgi:hypothetical protein